MWRGRIRLPIAQQGLVFLDLGEDVLEQVSIRSPFGDTPRLGKSHPRRVKIGEKPALRQMMSSELDVREEPTCKVPPSQYIVGGPGNSSLEEAAISSEDPEPAQGGVTGRVVGQPSIEHGENEAREQGMTKQLMCLRRLSVDF